MKRIITLSLTLIISIGAAFAQNVAEKPKKEKAPKAAKATKAPKIKPCKPITANLTSGTVNGLKPTAAMAEVKKKLPCFTGDTEEGGDFNCGGGVFYLNNDIYFYTGRDYVEIRSNFKGKTSPSVLGIYRDELKSKLGEPDVVLDGGRVWLYKRPYGTLRINFNPDDLCVEIAMHAVPPAQVKLCE